jgi:hypothetical protein
MRDHREQREQTEQFSKGFDAGNYGSAHESEDFESWYDEQDLGMCSEGPDYTEGAILGFFSSYELHEITDDVAREDVRALREKWGQS